MKPSTIETLVWVLLYGGLLILSVSVFVEPADGGLVTVLRWLGGSGAVAGVLLIVLRSRMKPVDEA
jgi:drug/metabolite transporter superfamily protein YnfA